MSHHAGSGSSRKGLDVDNILPRSPLDICSILCHCGRQYIFLHLHRAHSCPDIAVHARGPHGTARAPAAPTAERGAGLLSPAPQPGPAGHLGRPFPPFRLPLQEGQARPSARGEATWFPKSEHHRGLPSLGAPPPLSSPQPPAPLGPWPHTRFFGRREAGQRVLETSFLEHLSSASWAVVLFWFHVSWGRGRAKGGLPERNHRWPRTADRGWAEQRNARFWRGGSGGRASEPNGLHLRSQT